MTTKNSAIIHAAGQAFLDKGFGNTSMDYIAKASNVSKQTIYSHFSNKEELFIAVISQRCDSLWDSTNVDDAANPPTTEEFLTIFGKSLLNSLLCDDVIAMQRLIFSEIERFPNLRDLFYKAGAYKGMLRFQEYLEQQNKQGHLSIPNTVLATQFFCDMVKSTPMFLKLMGQIDTLSKKDIEARVNEAVRVFMAAYGT